uniref:Putative callose synthase 8 n=2 Tax=Anthurium amnicola TaxID=1678845 RepID=A0A1D1XHW2_9ARAE
MAEIVPAEDSSHRGLRTPGRPLATSRTVGHVRLPFDSEKVPLTLVQVVRPFLRVANQIEADSPRAAYLCRFHAFERAHTTDPKSNGRGVRQFKTALLKRLQQDEGATKHTRRESSDAKELKYLFYKYDHILKHARVAPSESREQLINAYTISSVLREVLKAVLSGTDAEMLADIEDGIYVPYNILPLDPGGSQQAIMQLPEIKASIAAIRNVCGLPLTEGHRKAGASMDLLDWLQHWFGFQKGNVANQREHLVLLLANLHVRLIPKPASMSKLDDRALSGLMEKMFENYINWCTFVGRKSNIQLPYIKQEEQQYKLLCIGLYLLIWGEASNLRFMPECLCYIFHHMVNELSGMLCGAISLNTGVKVAPAYGGESESFLKNIVTPLYMVIYEEAQKNNKGTADHSTWRNYDDLNEYFWSTDCFKLGWPMRLQCDFFCTLSSKPQKSINLQSITNEGHEQKWLGKMNFVEIRSFLQLFRSFDRMWLFFILAYQVIIITAWHGLESPFQLFSSTIFEDIMSIFITSAFIRLITGETRYPITCLASSLTLLLNFSTKE